jgi:hypothetical protein
VAKWIALSARSNNCLNLETVCYSAGVDRVILVNSGRRLAVLGPFTIADMLERAIADERSLSLASAPAYVLRQDSPGGAVRYAVVLGQALGRRALMDLLYTLAPYKAHGPDRFARVLDNWRLHDRAMTSSGSANLLLQHANSLKLSWQAFAQHRDRFIAAFEDQTENTRLVPVITWEKSPGGARSWQFDDLDRSLVEAIDAAVPVAKGLNGSERAQLDALVGLVTIPYFLVELRKSWRAWQPLVKNGKSNYVGPASVPVVALMHRRAILNSGFIRAIEALVAGT